MSLLPWPKLLGAAAQMGIPPEAFWRMSLKEWRMLTRGDGAMARGEFEALAALHPDRRQDERG